MEQNNQKDERYSKFPDGFFTRMDEGVDTDFYSSPPLVTHIDDGAISSVGAIYTDLGLSGRILDLMSSWVSHFEHRPDALVVAGMNAAELVARVLRHGATFCATFSNRCFPSKVIQGWAQTDDRTHVTIISEYFRLSGSWTDLQAAATGPPERPGDPLYAVWAKQGEPESD